MPLLLRVLIVDDNCDAADGLAKIVQLWGYDVRAAYDEGAISLADGFRPHVVLLDVGMPRMDGFAMAKLIRVRLPREAATVIAVTGYHDEITQQRCFESGFDHFLVKPVDTAALQALLATCGGPRGS